MPHVRDAATHNRLQQAYCEGFVARTIVPRESPQLRRQLSEVLRAGCLAPGDRVLEVGCGMGRFTLPLAARGVHVEGMDLSPVLLERFKAFDAGRFDVRLTVGDVLSPMPQFDDGFEVVLACFALHHLRDVDGAIGAMARMLKPGGRLVVLEANAFNPLFYAQILLTPGMTWQGDRGMMWMRPGVIHRAMRRAGLVRPTVTRFGCFPEFVTDRRWGASLESFLERLPLPPMCRAFQVFRAERP
jgi:SAM-dependent methyltransferase